MDEGFQDRLATQAADELQDALAETAAGMENICEDYDLASFLVILSALPLTFQRQNCSLQQWRTNAPTPRFSPLEVYGRPAGRIGTNCLTIRDRNLCELELRFRNESCRYWQRITWQKTADCFRIF